MAATPTRRKSIATGHSISCAEEDCRSPRHRSELRHRRFGYPHAQLLGCKSIEKRYPVSFMPHYESAMYGSWDKACELAGIHYIDPRWSVEKVLTEISASHKVVSEAMHGCIISDALRVPGGLSDRSRRGIEPSGTIGQVRLISRSTSTRLARQISSKQARRWYAKTPTF